jgi:hypothetical protein
VLYWQVQNAIMQTLQLLLVMSIYYSILNLSRLIIGFNQERRDKIRMSQSRTARPGLIGLQVFLVSEVSIQEIDSATRFI